MNKVIEEQIKRFVRKQRMSVIDKSIQAKCIVEEANELLDAQQKNYLGCEEAEIADVIITALVYAEISGFLDDVERLVNVKMICNLAKPIRKREGEKVSKI